MMEVCSSISIYSELEKKIPIPKYDIYWISEFGSIEKIGHEVIPTVAGDKECDILKETVKLGEIRTYRVDDKELAYKIVHEINSGTGQTVYTYTLVESGHESIKAGYDLTAVTGDEVDVKGNKGTYAMGEYAELEAEYTDEKGFGGWYDEKWNLLSTEVKIKVLITRDTVLYAVNRLSWDVEPNPGDIR